MPLSNDALDAAAAALAARYPYGNFTSSVPTGSGATETSGSARRQLTWSKTGTGVQTATISDTAANLGVGTTIAGGAYFTASTAGTYGGGAGITSRTLQSGDSITVTLTINAASQS